MNWIPIIFFAFVNCNYQEVGIAGIEKQGDQVIVITGDLNVKLEPVKRYEKTYLMREDTVYYSFEISWSRDGFIMFVHQLKYPGPVPEEKLQIKASKFRATKSWVIQSEKCQ